MNLEVFYIHKRTNETLFTAVNPNFIPLKGEEVVLKGNHYRIVESVSYPEINNIYLYVSDITSLI